MKETMLDRPLAYSIRGTMADYRTCAIDGCTRLGKSQTCPYDGRRHRHGRIHYDCGYPVHPVAFKADGEWHLVCDDHYAVLVAERQAFETAHSR